MKGLVKIVAIVTTVFFGISPAAFAANASQSFPINASVDGTLTLSVSLFRNTATGPGAAITALNFGRLQEFVQPAGRTLRSSDTGPSALMGAGVALISANSHGLPYVIKQTGTPLASGGNSIPSGACVVVPVYSPADNGGAALVGSLGTRGSWVATDKVLYTSDAAGSIRQIQAIYSITDDPAAGATAAVPTSQAAGSYSATVTFTVTA